jgi:uncharacterized membrane protein YGL010W
MIVLALMVLLSRPTWVVGELALSPAVFIVVVLLLYYLRLHIAMGLIMSALLVSGLFLSAWVATLDDAIWLAAGLGGFLLGWVIQFVGHYFEGRKPAFFDDVMGLAIGPLFVVAEVLFKLGLFSELAQEVENRSGPVRP